MLYSLHFWWLNEPVALSLSYHHYVYYQISHCEACTTGKLGLDG